MKLHTDFHDYYDYAVGYGIDENVHYNRFSKEVEIRVHSKFGFPNFVDTYLLGFCGKIYPFIKFKKFNKKYDWCEYEPENLKIVETFYAFNYEEYTKKESDWEDYLWHHSYISDSGEIKLKQFYLDWSFQSDEAFLELKVPAWVVKLDGYANSGILNPCLKDFDFERIRKPLEAFQDISMYLSNILVEQKEIVKVGDKVKIEKHGFDKKLSFRKRKKK